MKTTEEKDEYIKRIVKLTIFDPHNIDKIKELCTDPYDKQRIVVKGKNSENLLDLKPHSVTKKLMNFLHDEGYDIEIVKSPRRTGKKEIAGEPVTVYPLNRASYDNGVVINIVAQGKTESALEEDAERIRNKFMSLFVRNQISVKRMCKDMVECEYKFYNNS